MITLFSSQGYFCAIAAEGFQKGQIRFARAILLNALPKGDPDGRIGCQLRDECIEQSGLANTSPASLSVHRTFVVEFDTDANFQAGRVRGRVEHVVSGQATWFQSQAALLAFMAQLLREGRDGSSQTQGRADGEEERDDPDRPRRR